MLTNTCSAFVPGPNLCRNGFPQNLGCWAPPCHGCGRPAKDVPACMRDEVPPHLIDDSGRPKFAAAEYRATHEAEALGDKNAAEQKGEM